MSSNYAKIFWSVRRGRFVLLKWVCLSTALAVKACFQLSSTKLLIFYNFTTTPLINFNLRASNGTRSQFFTAKKAVIERCGGKRALTDNNLRLPLTERTSSRVVRKQKKNGLGIFPDAAASTHKGKLKFLPHYVSFKRGFSRHLKNSFCVIRSLWFCRAEVSL